MTMNDTFEFGRFAKLLKYECVNYLPNYMKGMVVFASFLVAAWLFTIASKLSFESRAPFMTVLFYFAVCLSPYFVYKDMNNRKKGYTYAMLPASTLEKLLSMIVVCVIVVPVMVYLALSVTDVLLYALSCAGAGHFTGLEFCSPFTVELEEGWGDAELAQLFDTKLIVLSCVENIAVFMMFNSIFRKHKIIKTLLFSMAVQFIFQIVIIFLALWIPESTWEEWGRWLVEYFRDMTGEEALSIIYDVMFTSNVIAMAIVLTITYFRIKRVNY